MYYIIIIIIQIEITKIRKYIFLKFINLLYQLLNQLINLLNTIKPY